MCYYPDRGNGRWVIASSIVNWAGLPYQEEIVPSIRKFRRSKYANKNITYTSIDSTLLHAAPSVWQVTAVYRHDVRQYKKGEANDATFRLNSCLENFLSFRFFLLIDIPFFSTEILNTIDSDVIGIGLVV